MISRASVWCGTAMHGIFSGAQLIHIAGHVLSNWTLIRLNTNYEPTVNYWSIPARDCTTLHTSKQIISFSIQFLDVSCYLDLCWIVISTACHEYSSIQAHDSKMIMVEHNSMWTSLSATMRQTQKYMGKFHHQSLVSRQRLQDRLDSFCQDQK
jgi:hypothetical protein